MKSFEDICKMTQEEVKAYMKNYLSSKRYPVYDEDGFLYAEGTVPVLLVAHMDTVHQKQCTEIINDNGKLSSPDGIGGDDRCGIFIIMNLIKYHRCSVLLCEDEEKGTVGARKFTKTDYINNLDVNFMIEFDRKGSTDAVFYSCDNKKFEKFVTETTGFKFAYGSFSDISVLMPAAKLAAVNLSSGYYNPHTTSEYVVYSEMQDTVEAAKNLISAECDKPFEYVARKYDYSYSASTYKKDSLKGFLPHKKSIYDYDDVGKKKSNSKTKSHNDGLDYALDLTDYAYEHIDEANSVHLDQKLYEMAKTDTGCELEVICLDAYNEETALYASGATKMECWMNMFLDNPDLCFNNIIDFTWC